MKLKLGLSLGYWGSGMPAGVLEQVTLAEQLGFESVWTAEAYGSDALTPLAWLGSHTERLGLGTSIVQMSARTPVATAMAAMTMDLLSGGRFRLGIGASGPQVVEGWYGQSYAKPLARTREYVDVLRQTFRRDVVTMEGQHFSIPFQSTSGLGKPLRSTLHPLRAEIPILLAAEGPKNVALAAEIADGWLPLFYCPFDDDLYRRSLTEGFAQRTASSPVEKFEVACMVYVIVSDDVESAADRLRPQLALYIGGMGARGANFHYDVFARLGFEEECALIQDLYLAGNKAAAIAAVPLKMVEKVALVGPAAKIRDELSVWDESLVTTMMVKGDELSLRTVAEAAR